MNDDENRNDKLGAFLHNHAPKSPSLRSDTKDSIMHKIGSEIIEEDSINHRQKVYWLAPIFAASFIALFILVIDPTNTKTSKENTHLVNSLMNDWEDIENISGSEDEEIEAWIAFAEEIGQ